MARVGPQRHGAETQHVLKGISYARGVQSI
jgi:hypothetical protein